MLLDARSPHARRVRTPLIAFAAGLVLLMAGSAHADAMRCKREVAKASAKFTGAKLRILQKCEDGLLTGKVTGVCPDVKSASAISKAALKLRSAIDKKCGGVDHDCSSTGDNDGLASVGWGAPCPNFEGGSCNNAITDCDGISNCLLCVDEAAVDQGINLYYDALTNSSDGAVRRCQREIGKSAVKFMRVKSKILQKCKDKMISGQFAGPCPDAKASAIIDNAAAKKNAKICGACGGNDRVCGGGDDLAPVTIGFPGTCPNVTRPNGGGACAGPVSTLQQLVNCVDCVSNYKSECVDRLSTPSTGPYPPECSGGGPPPETCGDNIVNGTEACDGTSDASCPGLCTGNCTCAAGPCVLPDQVPARIGFVGKPGGDLDAGWHGIGHNAETVDDGLLMAASVSNCDLNLGSPTCGQCDIGGPVSFPGPAKTCICQASPTSDTSSLQNCDPEAPACPGGETCTCLLGPPLPISAGGVPVCALNRLTSAISGTANISTSGPHAGEGSVQVGLTAVVYNGAAVDQPCPFCLNDPTPRDGAKGGTCQGGVRDGQPCDTGGISHFFGPLSIDCQPFAGGNIGSLAIALKPATTGTTELDAFLPCKQKPSKNCPCNTCATAAAEPCNTNADCPLGITCGGRRCLGGTNAGTPCTANSQCPDGGLCNQPGEPTDQNGCNNGLCSDEQSEGPNQGRCPDGPIFTYCSIERYRGCNANADCNPQPTGNCPSCAPGQFCTGDLRSCFLDPIVREGVPDTQTPIVAATFCIPPTSSGSVNQVAGLPGPGALSLPTRVFKIGAQCGNNAVDSGETCDGTADAACPGACQLDCACPGCGNGAVDPGEQCDGNEDTACPGQCQPSCQCNAATCGNNTKEFGEDCDGTDDASCPGACNACSCGAVCGNNVVEGSEECDGAGSVACPAEACQGDCTCGAFCGNNEIDAGEQCDGTGTGTCTGTCQADCQCAPFCGDDARQGSELCDGTDDSLCPGQCSAGCTCPSSATITFTVGTGADLDTGWTGTAHDSAVQKGSTISGELSNCSAGGDPVCDFFGNVGSACAADPTQACLLDSECSAGGCNVNTFGPPLPLSAGGVPACIVNRFATDVTGTYNLNTGSANLFTRLSSLVYLGVSVTQPCPICNCGLANPDDCAIGASGTCSNGGAACRVQGVGPLGPTSNECQPSSSSNVSGGGLDIPFQPVTTGTSTFASNQPCDGTDHINESCWCDGQPQANQCSKACDGGANNNLPCNSDGECPGAPAGACKPLCRQIVGEAVGEGECPAGPPTQTCANAPEIGCQTSSNCPGSTGPCQAKNQRCFLDPIVKVGTPGTTTNVSVATFCIPATSASAINQTAGLPGPGAISFPADIDLKICGDNDVNRFVEECDGTDDDNCPGTCLANCKCNRTCGNNTIEFGEQCDGTQSAACPGQCGAPASANPCVCPANCGDGFVGPGEECDPPNDDACPGTCSSCQCPVPTATCLNGTLDPGEPCEVPGVGCGPSQACLLCQQCFPPYEAIVPNLGFICGNLTVEPTEVCELPAIACGAGQLCLNCTQCVDAIPFCGNLNIEPGETCELPAIGCGPNQLCLLCGQCVDVPFSICGNLNIEPGEVCELPQQGCGPLALCVGCSQCVPLL